MYVPNMIMIPIKHCCCKRDFTKPTLLVTRVRIRNHPCSVVFFRCFGGFVSSTCLCHCHSHHHRTFSFFLWLHSETANWWADAKWFWETVSERLYSLRIWWCVAGLAVWQAALLLRNFCGGVQTLMSKNQKSYLPKRSRPVGRRQTSVVRFVSGRKLLLNLASSKQKLYPPSFLSWRVTGSVCSHFSDGSTGCGMTCFSCDLWN